jgi:hypothetical protein
MPSYLTVKVNVMVCTTFSPGIGIPLVLGGVAVAVIVTVDVPVGVVNAVFPPQADIPDKEPKSRKPAAHCKSSRRRAFRLLASPNRLKPNKRPLHQKIPVGVTIGD